MKTKHLLTFFAAAVLSASSAFAANFVLADWTFETSQPGTVTLPASPGAGVYFTNVSPEVGFGTGSSLHAAAATFSSPAGNGSSHSISAANWAVGDFYQYVVNTSFASNITVFLDTVSSATGPRDWTVSYSIDGINFTNLGTYTNSSVAWAAATSNAPSTHFFDLTPITAVNNQSTLYIRTTVTGTNAVNGQAAGIGTAGTSRNDNVIISGASGAVIPPVISSVTPASQTVGAGNPASFTVKLAAGASPFTYTWYHGAILPGNVVAGATGPTLTLPAVLSADAGNYQVVVSNAAATGATSSIVTLTVIDPSIVKQPASQIGLLNGRATFTVVAGGGALTYHWFYSDLNSNMLGTVNNGVNTYSTSVNFGATTSTLVVSNLTATDPTNFIVVVTDAGGSVTSSVASLISVSNRAPLAFWNFNGNNFSNNLASPLPYYGAGIASVVNAGPLSAVPDPNDGAGLAGFGLGGPPYLSWAAVNFPPAGSNSNKTAGVQFTTSSLGAQNIKVTYDARVTGTASEYNRLQFTTNGGVTWKDYPTSTTFGTPNGATGIGTNNQGQVGYAVSTYASFDDSQFPGYDLTGFPGVDNNPNFGIRIVTEWQSTGTYGASPNTNYYGVANTYAPGGTQSYDLVTISGVAITNTNAAPLIIGTILDTNVQQLHTVTNFFTVTNTANPVDNLVITAASPLLGLGNGNFVISPTGTNRSMIITPQNGIDGIAPVIVTATDTVTGLSSVSWFYLTVISLNPAPTNSLLNFAGTNMLSSANLSLPFTATDDKPVGNLTYIASSGNNTVLPSANITFNTNTAGSPIALFTSTNQLGAVPVTITVQDNDTQEPKTAPASFVLQVRPNTNVMLIDYFNYDASGAIFNVSKGLWTHLSGNAGTMQVGGLHPGYVVVDQASGNTENLQAKLFGAPYATNSAAVLFASFDANIFDSSGLPVSNGSYFAVFNDGSGATGNYACRVIAATNGAAAGNYRLGVSNGGADATASTMFPMDLVPGTDYNVVVKLVVSNNLSTIWVNPINASSPHVDDTNAVSTLFNISDFELRQSGANAGRVGVARLKVGTTFDSVLPALQIAKVGTNVVLTSSDPTLPVVTSTNNVQGPYVTFAPGTPATNSIGNSSQFYRLGNPTPPPGN